MALHYFRLFPDGTHWHEKVREHERRSGVYVLRRAGRVRYVGDSSSGTLALTLRRHFQRWKGIHVSVAYERGPDWECALVPTPPHVAHTAAASLADRLAPADQQEAREAAGHLWDRYHGKLRRKAKPKRGPEGQPFDSFDPSTW